MNKLARKTVEAKRPSAFQRNFKLDVNALKPGDIVSTTQLIDLTGCTPDSAHWSLRIQNVKEFIEKNAPTLVCRQVDSTLAVLTEQQKLPYLETRLGAGMSTVRKAIDYLETRVNPALLDSAERRLHESLLVKSQGLKRSIAETMLRAAEEQKLGI